MPVRASLCGRLHLLCVRPLTPCVPRPQRHKTRVTRLLSSSVARRAEGDPATSWLSRGKIGSKSLVLVSTSTDPFENLAIENHLLNHTSSESTVLYFYTNRPCVVIGRNQNPWVECDLKAIGRGLPPREGAEDARKNEEILLVRRRSGGGAVFHDLGNLNYSIITSNDKDFTRKRFPEIVAQALRQNEHALQGLGRHRVLVNERNDIVMQSLSGDGQPLKISGSAYKLTRGRALTHGTLLFASPNLGRISALLRSPGKQYLKAKGVESVRTPVGSLFDPTTDSDALVNLRDDLIQAISRYWRQEYAMSSEEQDISVVGSWDCRKEINPEIAIGVEELRSDEWRFEQTPGFEVDTGLCDGIGLKFLVRHGKMEAVELIGPAEAFKGMGRERVGALLVERKVHEIMDWKDVVGELQFPPLLIERLQLIFPTLTINLSVGAAIARSGDIKEVEVEGTNTVKEVPRHEMG